MFVTREKLEQIEAETLAPYALLSKNSKGRVYPESEPAYRTAFQRDRDRVIHSAAFRRLEYKTQVFVNDLGDYYRTRLTHTLEVSQIGRTMARAMGVNEDLVEVICLAHDLGHPPFGHAGEMVLNQLLSDFGGFNHNRQSFRVVTELEQRYPEWPGLNLTHETLEGIAKHETEYDVSEVAGYDPDLQGSLEAQIADVADELAYNAHDLDDGLQSGLITTDQLNDLEIWQELCERLDWHGGPIDEITRHRFIREQIGMQVTDILDSTMARIQTLEPDSPADIQRHSIHIVGHSETLQRYNRELKHFLYENMYYHYTVMRMSKRAERFIEELFESFVAERRQLPKRYQAMVTEDNPIQLVVADYIASLTDRSAVREYQGLVDPFWRANPLD